jgi:hypothetical protein
LVHAVQLPFAHADRDRFRPEPARFELPPRHDTVLLRRDPRYRCVGRVAFCVHMDV